MFSGRTTGFIFCSLCLGFITGCASSKNFSNTKKNEPIKSLLIFPVYSEISVIEKRDKRIKSDFFSEGAEAQIYKELEKYIPSGIHKSSPAFGNELEAGIIKSNINLLRAIRASLSPGSLKPPALLLHVMDSLNEDYGLIILQDGFTRTPENEKTQYKRGRNTAFATLGFFDREPNKAYSVMSGIIIDRQNKKLAKFKTLSFPNRNPNEEVVIRSQIRDIILSWFDQKE